MREARKAKGNKEITGPALILVSFFFRIFLLVSRVHLPASVLVTLRAERVASSSLPRVAVRPHKDKQTQREFKSGFLS